jgi:uncharacterized protein (TIGR02145 family)
MTMKTIFAVPIFLLSAILILSSGCKKKNDNTPSPAPTVTDIDGNVYHTVTIGSQVWMVENLKTTRYSNGVLIPLVLAPADWVVLATPGYCWYNNDATNKNPYGALYNWYAVASGILAPVGWHVPSDAEWTKLTDFLGGESGAGGKLKSTGTIEAATGLWFDPNRDATNSTGFSALPGGYRFIADGSFKALGVNGFWWSSTPFDASNSWYRFMGYISSDVGKTSYNNTFGFSVRCVKD